MNPRGEPLTAYYNEIDPYAAQWLRNLITAGHIAPGVVDERSIEDVTPNDLRDFTQCHFFAGIGVWSYALRRAGWPDDRPVWTGSCPCQPFSAAGKGAGTTDERHLWPHWFYLIEQRRPPIIFGEQVASKNAEPWLDLVCDDLESLDLTVGAVAFPSASIGSPHIRDRTYFLAHTDHAGLERRVSVRSSSGKRAVGADGMVSGMADALLPQRPDRQARISPEHDQGGRDEGAAALAGLCGDLRAGPVNGFWRAADWLLCRDGKWRPVEPGTFPLAHGAPARVGRLRAYGNAINAQQAQIFIECALDAIDT